MEAQAPTDKVYPVPAEVHSAVMTGRPAILAPLIARIANGQEPTKEEWLGVVEMMADRMVDRLHEREAWREEKEQLIADLRATFEELRKRTINALDAVDRRINRLEEEALKHGP